ncbi:hypothetical protein Dimus_012389 [Dionaea muscipula]
MRSLMLRALKTNHFTHPATAAGARFGPFDSITQRRWKKPADTARTRLENRTRDLKLDKLMVQRRKLDIALNLFDLMSKRRGHYVSLQIMARWANRVGLKVDVTEFLRKYPHVFEIFSRPLKKNLCCRVTEKMRGLIDEESAAIRDCEVENVRRVKKLLMMSKSGTLHMHALGLVKRELGLPDDFRHSILGGKYSNDFKLIDSEIVGLVERRADDDDDDDDERSLAVAKVEEWREKEYTEKWLSEFETKYAFPVNFPTGFKFEKGFREAMRIWQRTPYVKPYETTTSTTPPQRFEKRVVGILHELLSLTVEKTIQVERLVHFRRDLGIPPVINFRELLLKHPGIFYISTKGPNQTVFLRDAYNNTGSLQLHQPNPIHGVRKKMLDLLMLGCRNTRELESAKEEEEEAVGVDHHQSAQRSDGFWVIPLLETESDQELDELN